jgi:hypothetical protein
MTDMLIMATFEPCPPVSVIIFAEIYYIAFH